MLTRADLELLQHIHRAGSLAGAARALDLAPPAVTKRLAALESRLGLQLVQRNTRKLALNAAGLLAVERGAPLLTGMADLQAAMQQLVRAGPQDVGNPLQGTLRIVSSSGFGRMCLAPLLHQMQVQHPQLRFELRLLDQLPATDPAASPPFDAAVWLWRPRQSGLVARPLASNRRVVVAAPAYLARAGMPRKPADLARHACLVVQEHVGPHGVWRLQGLQGLPQGAQMHSVRVQGPLVCNLGEVARDWALAGAGLALRSWWDVQPWVQSGQLVHVLPRYAMHDADVLFITPRAGPLQPQALAQQRRLAGLYEFLHEGLARAPWAR